MFPGGRDRSSDRSLSATRCRSWRSFHGSYVQSEIHGVYFQIVLHPFDMNIFCTFSFVYIFDFMYFIQYIDKFMCIFAYFASNFLILYFHMINISICVFLGSSNADGNFVEAVALKKSIVWVGNGPCILHLLRKAGVRMRACFLAGLLWVFEGNQLASWSVYV